MDVSTTAPHPRTCYQVWRLLIPIVSSAVTVWNELHQQRSRQRVQTLKKQKTLM